MREDEAVVLLGVTPPQAEYFGFTMYLNNVHYEFGDVSGGYSGGHLLLRPPEDNRTYIQASLEDPINPSNINVISDGTFDDSFDKDFVIVTTGDNSMNDVIKKGLIDVDIPPEIFNLQVSSCLLFDVRLCSYMLDCDQIYVALRCFLFADFV